MLELITNALIGIEIVLPIVTSIFLIVRRETKFAIWFRWAVISSVCCYGLLIVSVSLTEIYLENRLDQYDLDGNGTFNGEEITPELQNALKDVSSDTGRTFTFITGLILCPIHCGFWHLVIGLPYGLIRRRNLQKAGDSQLES